MLEQKELHTAVRKTLAKILCYKTLVLCQLTLLSLAHWICVRHCGLFSLWIIYPLALDGFLKELVLTQQLRNSVFTSVCPSQYYHKAVTQMLYEKMAQGSGAQIFEPFVFKLFQWIHG